LHSDWTASTTSLAPPPMQKSGRSQTRIRTDVEEGAHERILAKFVLNRKSASQPKMQAVFINSSQNERWGERGMQL
jgi:hypothetical protein